MNVQLDLFEGKPQLTAERLRELLHYDPETGIFTWRINRGNQMASVGSRAGTLNRGYRRIVIDRTAYFAHRLAWLYIANQWPNGQIDHRNNTKDDNQWLNLRQATNGQNMINSPLRSDNTSGVAGVRMRRSGSWKAQINIRGKLTVLGTFRNKADAIAARKAAEAEHYGEYAYQDQHSRS